MTEETQYLLGSIGAICSVGFGAFVKLSKDIGQNRIDFSNEFKELWKAQSASAENRVRREDVTDIKETMHQQSGEIRDIKSHMMDLVQTVGEIKGRMDHGSR